QAVAERTGGLDLYPAPGGGQLLAQVGDVDIDAAVVGLAWSAQGALEEFVLGQHVARATGQQQEQVELRDGEAEFVLTEPALAAGRRQAQGSDYDLARACALRLRLLAAQDGPEARGQLAGMDGLGDVVVGAELQADDAVDA